MDSTLIFAMDKGGSWPSGRLTGMEVPCPRKTLLLAFLALLVSGCAFLRIVRDSQLKTPAFTFVECRLTGANESQANLEIVLKAYNPNTIGLRNVMVNYELFHKDNRFVHGGASRDPKPRTSGS